MLTTFAKKSEEVSENYYTQSQPLFNIKRLVQIEHDLCDKRATVTSQQFYLIIFLTHFEPN